MALQSVPLLFLNTSYMHTAQCTREKKTATMNNSRQKATNKNKNIYCYCTLFWYVILYWNSINFLRAKYITYVRCEHQFFLWFEYIFLKCILASSTAKTDIIFCQIELFDIKILLKKQRKKKERKKVSVLPRLWISARCKCFANLFFATNMSSN